MHSNRKLLTVWLCSAAVVTIARVFNAADPGELPIQIQAGQHLVAGKGLTVYSSPGEDDLAQPAKLVGLAHFPAGYSLYAAALLALGAGVGTLVRFYFALTTMLGWWGWGILARHFFRGMSRNQFWTATAFIIAACTPLLYTMPWKGTDIFLWAAIPWVLWWIAKPLPDDTLGWRWFDFGAGLLCGLTFLMRYAALFLVVYVAVVIVWQSIRRPKSMAWRVGSFAIGLLPFFVPQIYLSLFAPNREAIPDIFTLQRGLQSAANRIAQGIPHLPSANVALAWWMPHQLLDVLIRPGNQALWPVCLTVIGWGLLAVMVVRKVSANGATTAAGNLTIIAAGFLVMLPLFLLGWTGVAEYIYVFEPRYYLPVIPLAVLLGYELAIPAADENRFPMWLRNTSLMYVGAYLCIGLITITRLLLPGDVGTSARVKMMGMFSDRFHWPSIKMVTDYSPGRSYIAGLFRESPGAVLVTNHEEWFYCDPTLDQSRIRRPKDMRAEYVSGPARIIIAIQDHSPGPLTSVAWFGHYDQRWVADYFEELPAVRLLKAFPEEQIRVVEAIVPLGARIPLKKETARIAGSSRQGARIVNRRQCDVSHRSERHNVASASALMTRFKTNRC